MDGIIAELVNWPEYSKVFLAIYALISPPVVLPAYLSLMADRSAAEKARAAWMASVTFFFVLVVFTIFGTEVLSGFGITLYGFQVAGGVLLMRVGFDMIYTGQVAGEPPEHSNGSLIGVTIMPITIPLLAGPGAISAVTVFSGQHDIDPVGHKLVIIAVLMILAVVVFVTYRFAILFDRLLNPTVMSVVSKIMGLLICAIAAEFIIYGIAGHFPQVQII